MIPALVLCLTVTVWDGDTIRCNGERVRIANIDAPELPGSPRCDPRHLRRGKNPSWCNTPLAIRSRDELRRFVLRGRVEIERQGVDRYGRVLARVTVNGRDAGQHLVRRGLAREWK